jgi:carbonic anhydrase/acetyltransferase-like protein (isoleucine patch superfamily)
MIIEARGKTPQIDSSALIFPNACIIGDVRIGAQSSIWSQVTIRGDVFPMVIGRQVNIQDNSVLHGTYGKCGVILSDRVTIGHGVILHGCEIGSGTLVGMGSIIMDQVKIGKNCLIGAGSLITEGQEFPDNSLILGRPAKLKRSLTPEEILLLEQSADNYLLYSSWYKF